MTDSSQNALRKQRLNSFLATAAVVVALFAFGRFVYQNYQAPTYQIFERKVDLPVDEFKAKEVWMDRLEGQVNFISQKQKFYEDTLLEYKARETENEQEKNELKLHLTQLKNKLEESESKVKQIENEQSVNASQINTLLSNDESRRVSFEKPRLFQKEPLRLPEQQQTPQDPFVSQPPYYSKSKEIDNQPLEIVLRTPICEFTAIQEEKNELFSIEKRTPANISVKAILISSVDAVCRLNAHSDPVPVKLRLLDDGYLPGGLAVKLKGCLIGASAYGDISSERVYMRLENLTKVNADGQAIETVVTGYVSGEDGRFGMRGIVVDRSAKILKPALGSGILSGIAKTLQSACTRPPRRESINAYSVGTDIAQNAADGTSDAFNMLASYYIKRAEQVQPVLQIDAGRIVDVTFTHGFSMGDIHAKANLKEIRERNRR